jgi:hypothetical protein
MPELELFATGGGDYRLHDPDAIRGWMRDRNRRDLVDEPRVAVTPERLAPPTAGEAESLRNPIDPARIPIGRTTKS